MAKKKNRKKNPTQIARASKLNTNSQGFSTPKTVEATIPEMVKGERKMISNVNGQYLISDLPSTESSTFSRRDMEEIMNIVEATLQATEDMYERNFEKDTQVYGTTNEKINDLSKNPQNNLNKILEINAIAEYYANKNDIVGNIYKTLNNNVNTNYSISFPCGFTKAKKKEEKMIGELKQIIKEFNTKTNLEAIIVEAVVSTYMQGNYNMVLRGEKGKGYIIVKYPMQLIEMTPLSIDKNPILSFNVATLRSYLTGSLDKFRNCKSIDKNIMKSMEEQIKRDYPKEVYKAFEAKDNYALLDSSRTGMIRINNMGKMYGVTPILNVMESLLMLETIDNVDRKNVMGKAKKLYVQRTVKELATKDDADMKSYMKEMQYAHASLCKAMQSDCAIYTGMPFVEGVDLVEPKIDVTDYDTKNGYRNRVLNGLGIGYLTNETKSGSNTVKMNYEEILKTINTIVRQIEVTINRFYKAITIENGFPVEYAPTIDIQDTKMLDLESKLKLADTVFSKVGLSYQTTLETLGYNVEEEKRRREEENKKDYESIFIPHANSYTSNSNELLDEVNDNGSKKSDNIDKSLEDKERKENEV